MIPYEEIHSASLTTFKIMESLLSRGCFESIGNLNSQGMNQEV